MKKKLLFIIGGAILAIIAFIIGLAIAGVNVFSALTSTTAILIYVVVAFLIIFYFISKFIKGWKK